MRRSILVLGLAIALPALAIAAGCGRDRNAPILHNSSGNSSNSGSQSTSAGGGSSSGGGGNDPQAACQSLEDKLSACESALKGSLMCSRYATATCDLSGYFSCVDSAYGSCSGGTFPNADLSALMSCAQMANC